MKYRRIYRLKHLNNVFVYIIVLDFSQVYFLASFLMVLSFKCINLKTVEKTNLKQVLYINVLSWLRRGCVIRRMIHYPGLFLDFQQFQPNLQHVWKVLRFLLQ